MRILLLAPFDLFPPVHGGSAVVHNYLKSAAQEHHVTALLSHLYSQGGAPDVAGPNVTIRYCRSSLFDRLRVLSFLVNPHYFRAAEAAFDTCEADVVQCEILWTMAAGWRIKKQHGVPLVWIAHNVEAAKYAEMGAPSLLLRLIRKVEGDACRRADHIIALSQADRQQLISLYGVSADRISVIMPGPDLDEFRFDATVRGETRARLGLGPHDPLVTFVGNLRYAPNQEAVRNLAEAVYPAVMSQHPEARFVVIGQGQEQMSQWTRDRLTFTGYLSQDQLVAHLCATDVFAVPVEKGSGIRVKIPEATAVGCPVVVTEKAAAGLEMFAADELWRTPDARGTFAEAVLKLLADPEGRRQMGARAQARTQRDLSWAAILKSYEAAYLRAREAASP